MRMNPIVKKDVKVQSRSMRICWSIFGYELILALVFFLAMLIIQQQSRYSTGNIYSSMVWLYPVLAVTQLIILGVVVPVRTASSISGEKERQTFDIMMTTSMTPFSIVMGKVMTAMVQGMFFVVASMPVMALAFVIGGLSWGYLFWFLAIALLVSLFSASIGIFCSSVCKKSITAVIMSYGFYVIFFLVTFVPIFLAEIAALNMGQSTYPEGVNLVLLINPAVFLVEFFARVMTGESVMNSLVNLNSHPSAIMKWVASGYWWLILSAILFVAVSFLFLWMTSRNINPMKHAKKRKKKG